MHNNQEWEYQDADLDYDISERSKLYSLKPIGIGTSNVESLSSYICRLAEAHCLDAKKFIKRIIFPNMKMLTFKYDRLLTRNFYAQNMRTENRTFWMPHEIAVTLEELTQQNNLTSLTLSKWRYIIGNRYSHKAYLAWCPICFNEWENKNRPIYQPMLWTFREVNYCPHHKVKLQ